MATASTSPGEATAPQTQVEGNPYAGVTGDAELDTLLAAGLSDIAGSEGAAPSTESESEPPTTPKAKAKAKTPATETETAPTEESEAGTDELSSLIEGTADDEDEEAGDQDEETDPEGEDEDGGEEESEPEANTPKWVKKRLAKMAEQKRELKAAKAEAETKLAALTKELETLRENRIVAAPTPGNPLAGVVSLEDLNQRAAAAKAVRSWCVENIEGGSYQDAKGEIVELSAAEVARRKAYADELLAEHIPARKNWIERRQQAAAEARRVYPTLYQDGKQMAAARQSLLQSIPGLADDPDADIFIGDAVVGAMVRAGRLKVFKPGSEKPAAAAQQPTPRSAPKPTAATEPRAGKVKAAAAVKLEEAAARGDSRALAEALALTIDG